MARRVAIARAAALGSSAGFSSSAISRSRVVFPRPDGPMMATRSPGERPPMPPWRRWSTTGMRRSFYRLGYWNYKSLFRISKCTELVGIFSPCLALLDEARELLESYGVPLPVPGNWDFLLAQQADTSCPAPPVRRPGRRRQGPPPDSRPARPPCPDGTHFAELFAKLYYEKHS